MQVLNWTNKRNRDKTHRQRAGRQPQGRGQGWGDEGTEQKKGKPGGKRTQVLLTKFNLLAEKNLGRLFPHCMPQFLRASLGEPDDQGTTEFLCLQSSLSKAHYLIFLQIHFFRFYHFKFGLSNFHYVVTPLSKRNIFLNHKQNP